MMLVMKCRVHIHKAEKWDHPSNLKIDSATFVAQLKHFFPIHASNSKQNITKRHSSPLHYHNLIYPTLVYNTTIIKPWHQYPTTFSRQLNAPSLQLGQISQGYQPTTSPGAA